MNVVRHDDEFVQKVCSTAVMVDSVDEKLGPGTYTKESAALPGLSRDHVALTGVGRVFSLRPHCIPQGLKPLSIWILRRA